MFIHKLDCGVEGLAYASLITYSSMFVFVTVFSHCLKDLEEALFWPTRDTFTSWGQYIKIGLPSVVMLCAECWAFQVMGVFAGLISVNDQAANTIMMNLVGILFQIPGGAQSAAAAMIGEAIGAN